MFRPGEYTDKSPKHQLEAALDLLWCKLSNWWLFSDDEFEFGYEIHNEQSVRIYRLTKVCAPSTQFGLTLAQKRTDKALKSLR